MSVANTSLFIFHKIFKHYNKSAHATMIDNLLAFIIINMKAYKFISPQILYLFLSGHHYLWLLLCQMC